MLTVLLEHDNLRKARRALLISSAATLLVHGINISGDALNFFGLKLSVNENSIQALGKILSIYFLAAYACFLLPHLSKMVLDKYEHQSSASKNSILKDATSKIQDQLGWEDDKPASNAELFDMLVGEEVSNPNFEIDLRLGIRKKRDILLHDTAALMFDFALPITLGVGAIWYPHEIYHLVS